MDKKIKNAAAEKVSGFSLPEWREIPDVGLYLNQTTKYISDYLSPIGMDITSSMISNYVKKDLVKKPVKKMYDREQIAALIFIAFAKSVLSMDDIGTLFSLLDGSFTPEEFYTSFSVELSETLNQIVSGANASLRTIDEDDEKYLLHSMITAVAHKIFLNCCFSSLKKDEDKK